jgi:RNA polymerase-binding transcription factor DksA
MADEADIANASFYHALEASLSLRLQNNEVRIGAIYCKECEETIPQARRALGFNLCVDCAFEKERRKSQFAD